MTSNEKLTWVVNFPGIKLQEIYKDRQCELGGILAFRHIGRNASIAVITFLVYWTYHAKEDIIECNLCCCSVICHSPIRQKTSPIAIFFFYSGV